CVACSAGTKQCSGKTPQTCSSAGEWESQNSCAQSEICSNGTCVKCPGTGGPTMVGLPLGYCIDSTEVTRIQYAAWLSSTSSATLEAQDAANCGWNKSFTPSSDWTSLTPAGPNKPVAYVDWCDAYAYCKGVGKRLCGMQGGGSNPFEKYAELQSSQWYAACTSNGPNSYSYGSTYEPTKCNGQDAAIDATVAVGARTGCTPTVIGYQGIYDLSGNVSEWEDSCEPREAAVYCRLRGGNYTLGAAFVMCGTHAEAPRSDAHAEFGFRCCAF
ncbi:MAG: formylglycine-generating enzyme family protein, partial [Myxococcales bacterium]